MPMKVRRILLTGAALLLATALTVSAQGAIDPAEQARRFPTVPTPTTLYFHINGFQEFPINTQAPDDRFRETVTVGTLTNSNGCVKDPSGSAGVASQEFHTFYGYVSPSYVQYDVIENGKPRIHQERGIAYDVQLGGDFTLKWYVETQALSGDPTPDINGLPVPMVLPDVMVRASMRAGDVISIQNKAYNEGALIAQGVSGPFTLAGAMTGTFPATGAPEGSVSYTTLPNGHHLYEFTVPMKLSQNIIPREDGANMR
ncbi:MAG TPA: hypothetical protein VFH47_06400, partial [Candidatus Thermoplasmatota archaeon]|nr:hypothetical protein [Candidatus Thermoplasmatota archaeon]